MDATDTALHETPTARRAEATPSPDDRALVRRRALGALGAWLVLAALANASFSLDLFRPGAAVFPVLVMATVFLLPVAFVTAYHTSPGLRDLALSLNPRLVVLPQTIRFGGVVFIALYSTGELAGPFALWAGGIDAVIGSTAALVAFWVVPRLRSPGPRHMFVAWNLLGLVDFIVGVPLFLLYSSSAVGVLSGEVTTDIVATRFPLNMIGTFGVPLASTLHLIALFQARRCRIVDRHSGSGDINQTETGAAVERPFPYLEGVEHRFVDIGELKLHLAEAGAGDPLVMLHGWPQHWWMWRHQIPALAERYRVICPDLRGLGWSDAPRTGYDKETLAADVDGLLDVLKLPVEKVRLMGHDWGAFVGFLLCLHHPERIERFLALNVAPPWGKTDLRTVAGSLRLWSMALLAAPLVGSLAVRRLGYLRLVSRIGMAEGTWTEEDLAAYREPLRERKRARASVRLFRTFLTREFPSVGLGKYRDRRLATPTLLLFGANDFVISTSFLRGYEPFVDDLELEIVPDCGHFIAEERPELVTRRALEFFAAS